MFYVFGYKYEDQLVYHLDSSGANIFCFDSEEALQNKLDVIHQTNDKYKAYRLVEV